MSAIDLYFAERNRHFRENPRRAGRKISGLERVPANLDEATRTTLYMSYSGKPHSEHVVSGLEEQLLPTFEDTALRLVSAGYTAGTIQSTLYTCGRMVRRWLGKQAISHIRVKQMRKEFTT